MFKCDNIKYNQNIKVLYVQILYYYTIFLPFNIIVICNNKKNIF